MKKNMQKMLNVSLCVAIIMILTGSTVSYGMAMKLWSERDKKIASLGVVDCAFFGKWVQLPHLYAGTSKNNPVLWIVQEASDKQLDLFKRMHEEGKRFSIGALGADDEDAFHRLPGYVKSYVEQLFGTRK